MSSPRSAERFNACSTHAKPQSHNDQGCRSCCCYQSMLYRWVQQWGPLSHSKGQEHHELAPSFSSRLHRWDSSSADMDLISLLGSTLERAQLPSQRALPDAWDMVRSRFQTAEHWPSQSGQGLSREYPPHSLQSSDTWSSYQLTPHVKQELSWRRSSSMDKTASLPKNPSSSKELPMLRLWWWWSWPCISVGCWTLAKDIRGETDSKISEVERRIKTVDTTLQL